ncbi:MAG: nicotinate-nucleotide--dimethylbenzimidazole phosphoribosyltransferase [Planctomycetota bacterium]
MELINKTIRKIKDLDYRLMRETQKRLDNLTKPQGSLGRLEELAKQICGITGQAKPSLKNKLIITMAGDHGVAEEGVSAYPAEVTPQMVYNFLRGGAGINVLARQVGAQVLVVDMGVASKLQVSGLKNVKGSEFRSCKINFGTKNFTKGPAMSREEAVKSITTGIKLVNEQIAKGINIIGTGDMGIANTTPSAAIISVLSEEPVEKIAGRGTGINDASLKNKINVIKKAIKVNKPKRDNPIDVLAKVGGFEIGGIAGVILGAAAGRIPVVVDGFISGAAALLAASLAPKVNGYLIASHCSAENGHRCTLQFMNLSPLLDMNLRLGEGTGAALAMSLAESAVRILTEMATFESAGVSEQI